MRLVPLAAEHADAVLAFETVNRAWFAASVPDRGDAFFADYPARHAALLALQEAGTDRFHLLLTDDDRVAGRVNLVDIRDGAAELGYRIGAAFAGRGLATDAVRRVCRLAADAYALDRLRASVDHGNHASRAVLLRNGFREAGRTATELSFVRDLV